jgi:hypothetical protein
MTSEQLKKGEQIQSQIEKLEAARDEAVSNMDFRNFPEMDYNFYQTLRSSIHKYYNDKIRELNEEFNAL